MSDKPPPRVFSAFRLAPAIRSKLKAIAKENKMSDARAIEMLVELYTTKIYTVDTYTHVTGRDLKNGAIQPIIIGNPVPNFVSIETAPEGLTIPPPAANSPRDPILKPSDKIL